MWASLTVRLSGVIAQKKKKGGGGCGQQQQWSPSQRDLCVRACVLLPPRQAPEGGLKGHVMPPTLDCRAWQRWHRRLRGGWDERVEAGREHGLAEGDGEGFRGIRANIQFTH